MPIWSEVYSGWGWVLWFLIAFFFLAVAASAGLRRSRNRRHFSRSARAFERTKRPDGQQHRAA